MTRGVLGAFPLRLGNLRVPAGEHFVPHGRRDKFTVLPYILGDSARCEILADRVKTRVWAENRLDQAEFSRLAGF
jgi:hypothetical protein